MRRGICIALLAAAAIVAGDETASAQLYSSPGYGGYSYAPGGYYYSAPAPYYEYSYGYGYPGYGYGYGYRSPAYDYGYYGAPAYGYGGWGFPGYSARRYRSAYGSGGDYGSYWGWTFD